MLKDKFLRNDGADGADTCDYVSYPSGTLFVPFPSKILNRWYSYMPPVSEIIGTGCSCYYAHGVWNLACTVCVCGHLPSPPQEEKRHKVKMPCASVLKCQRLTSVVNVWKGEFDMTEICFLQCLCKAESLYRTDVNLMWVQCKKVTEKVMEMSCSFVKKNTFWMEETYHYFNGVYMAIPCLLWLITLISFILYQKTCRNHLSYRKFK